MERELAINIIKCSPYAMLLVESTHKEGVVELYDKVLYYNNMAARILALPENNHECIYLTEALPFISDDDLSDFNSYGNYNNVFEDKIKNKVISLQIVKSEIDAKYSYFYLEQYNFDTELHDVQSPIKQSNKCPVCDSFHQEVLKRISYEAYLMKENEFFKQLLDESPALIAFKDSKFRYTFINKASAHFLGIGQDEIIGKSDEYICTKEEAEYHRSIDKKVIENNFIYTGEDIYTDLKGKIHYIKTVKSPCNDRNGNIGIQFTVTDVTEQRKIEQELLKIKDTYEFVTHIANSIVWFIDRKTLKHTFVSPSVEKILGYKMDEYLNLEFNELIASDSLETAYKVIKELDELYNNKEFDLLKQSRQLQLNIIHKNGDVKRGNMRYSTIINEDNDFVGFFGSTYLLDF